MLNVSNCFPRILMIAGLAITALPASAATILLTVQAPIAFSTLPDVIVGSAFSMTLAYDPATPPDIATPFQSSFTLKPGPFAGGTSNGKFLAQNSEVSVTTQQTRNCFDEVLNKPIPCSAFVVEANFVPGDLTGAFATDKIYHVDLLFEDDSSSLVSEFALPSLPFPPVSAWSHIYFSGFQQGEGGGLFSGTITSLTATSVTTPEPGTILMFAVGITLIGFAKGRRRPMDLSPRTQIGSRQ